MPVPTAKMLVALIVYIAGPMMEVPAEPEQEQTATPSAVAISIADDTGSVVGGQAVRYRVTISNATEVPTPVTIRLTLSSGTITELKAESAAVIANAVAWKNTLAAGTSRTYSVAGIIDAPAKAGKIAATACVHLSPEETALSCVTDLNLISAPASRERNVAWLLAILLGLLAAAGAIWLQKKITPEPLTPANADATPIDNLGRPSGAPPV